METLKKHIDESLFSGKSIDAGELSNKIKLQYLKEHIFLTRLGSREDLSDRLELEIDEDNELTITSSMPFVRYVLAFRGDLSSFPYKIKQIKLEKIEIHFEHCQRLKNFKDIFSKDYMTWDDVEVLALFDCPGFESFEGWPKIQEVQYLCLPETPVKSYKGIPRVYNEIIGGNDNWCINNTHSHSFGVEACLVDIDRVYNALPKCPVKNYINRELRAYFAKVQSS